jgi:hypothetical protein
MGNPIPIGEKGRNIDKKTNKNEQSKNFNRQR